MLSAPVRPLDRPDPGKGFGQRMGRPSPGLAPRGITVQEVIRSSSNPLVKRARAVAAGRARAGSSSWKGGAWWKEALAAGWALELVLLSEERGSLAEELARGPDGSARP